MVHHNHPRPLARLCTPSHFKLPLTPDSPIPAFLPWNDNNPFEQPGGCRNTSGREVFFAYTYGAAGCPGAWCTTTGLESVGAEVLTFIRDEGGGMSLAITHGSQGNLLGGTAKVLLDASDLAGRGVHLEKYDDRAARNYSRPGYAHTACSGVTRDCHSWDTDRGMGSFSWKWGAFASDGMLIGPFPPVDDANPGCKPARLSLGPPFLPLGSRSNDWPNPALYMPPHADYAH